jgi:hypothetical protein
MRKLFWRHLLMMSSIRLSASSSWKANTFRLSMRSPFGVDRGRQISISRTSFTEWCTIRIPRRFLEWKEIDLASLGVSGALAAPPWSVGAYPERSVLASTPS